MSRFGSKQGEGLAWAWVALWTLGIFLAIPLARTIERFVRDEVGQAAFGWFVLGAVAVATAFALRAVATRRNAGIEARSPRGAAPLAWLVGVAAIFVAATLSLWDNPEEAMHFVQYAVLGGLLHRALRHRIADASVYVVAALVGILVGCLDEALQWLTPKRYFGLRDIGINAFASALAQLAIAKGFRPPSVGDGFEARGVRVACRVAAGLLGVLLLFTLNTPERTARWALAVPGLGFLAHNESTMMEYGYRYELPRMGVFRSRLGLEELREIDAARTDQIGAQVAACLVDYSAFLVATPPSRDAFLHELCVHLFRRNRYQFFVGRTPDDITERRKLSTVVVREERFLREYFGESLRVAGVAIPEPEFRELEADEFADLDYESTVSVDLVTEWREWQLLVGFALGFGVLGFVYQRAGRAR